MFCRKCGSDGSDSAILCHGCRSSIHMKRKINRRIIFIFLIIFAAAAVGLSACGGNKKRMPVSGEFDDVLAYGDGYYLVIKKTGDRYMIGVTDADARWIQPLSEEHIFLREGKRGNIPEKEGKADMEAANIYYIEEGMFLMIRKEAERNCFDAVVYNARDNIGFIVRQYGMCGNTYPDNGPEQYRPPVCYKNGYWVILTGSGKRKEICIVDRCGHIRRTAKRAETIGQYSEGVFFADGCFYDLYLNSRLILKEYQIINAPYFQKGKSSLTIKTSEGEKYRIEIDRNGKLLKRPEKL